MLGHGRTGSHVGQFKSFDELDEALIKSAKPQFEREFAKMKKTAEMLGITT